MEVKSQAHNNRLIDQRSSVLGLVLKIGLALLIFYFLYRELYVKRDLDILLVEFGKSWRSGDGIFLLPVILLMPFNWMAESKKWQKLTSYFTDINFWHSLQMILVGLTFGIITPARIGEYGGRFYMMTQKHQWKTISAMFVGSLAQNIVTGTVGLLSATYLIFNNSAVNSYLAATYFYVVGFLVILGLLVFYKISVFQHLLEILPFRKCTIQVKRHSHYLISIHRSDLHYVLSLSVVRYAIYGFQYYLLLQFFGIEVGFLEGSCVVALLFLIQSGLPLPPLLNVMARGEIAILVWSLYTPNTLGILATTFSLWLINLIFPALVGLVLILKHKNQ